MVLCPELLLPFTYWMKKYTFPHWFPCFSPKVYMLSPRSAHCLCWDHDMQALVWGLFIFLPFFFFLHLLTSVMCLAHISAFECAYFQSSSVKHLSMWIALSICELLEALQQKSNTCFHISLPFWTAALILKTKYYVIFCNWCQLTCIFL